MRKRIALLASLAMTLGALALPASAAAAPSPYTYRVISNFCDGPDPNIKVKMIKPAGYYPEQFRMIARGQHSTTGSGGWSNEGASSPFSHNVPQQYAKYSWANALYWEAPDSKWHRIKLTLRVMDNGNIVASKTIYSVAR